MRPHVTSHMFYNMYTYMYKTINVVTLLKNSPSSAVVSSLNSTSELSSTKVPSLVSIAQDNDSTSVSCSDDDDLQYYIILHYIHMYIKNTQSM